MSYKKKIAGLISGVMTISLCISAYGATIKINDKVLESDVEPQIIDGRTMVPVRAIFEGMGATVNWDAETKTVTGKLNDITVKMVTGEKNMTVNNKQINIDGSVMIIDSRTFAPARYVAEAFGYGVSWNEESKEVLINDKAVSGTAVEKATNVTTAAVEKSTETTTAKAKEETTVNKTESTTVKAADTKNGEKTTAKEENKTTVTTEGTTETTTLSAAQILNSSPVQGVTNKLYKLIKNDINTAFKNYYVGGASSNGRFQPATSSKLMDAWELAITTDEDKTYVAQSKIVYQNIVTTCKKIDQRKEKNFGSSSVATYCTERKDKLEDLINTYFASTNVEEAKKNAEAIKKFATATLNK